MKSVNSQSCVVWPLLNTFVPYHNLQKLKKHLLPALFWLFPAWALFAQQDKIAFDYNFIHYDIEDGLPSNETYIFKEDQEGYLWIGTDKGVARFNGYEFKNYTTNDGLTDNTILRMALGPDGKLWMVGYNNTLCYADKGKIYPFEKNADLLKLASTFFGSAEIEIDQDNQIFYRSLRGAAILSQNGEIRQIFKPRFPGEPETHHFIRFNNTLKSWCSAPEVRPGPNKIRVQFADSSVYNTTLDYKGLSSYSLELGSTLYFSVHETLLIIENNKTVKEKKYDNEGLGMLIPIEDELWMCSLKGIVVLDKKGNVKKQLLQGEQISSIYEDKNKNIWISTLNNGIYQIKNRAVSILKKNGFPINHRFPILMNISKRVIAVNYTNETACSMQLSQEANLEIYNQYCNYNEQVALNELNPETEVQFTFEQHFIRLDPSNRIKSIFQKNGVVYAISHMALFQLKQQDGSNAWEFLSHIGHNNKSFSTLFVVNEHQILLGSREGFFLYNNGKYSEHPRNKELNSRVQDIELLGADTILGTRGNGLKILRPGGLLSLTENEGLLKNTVNSIFKYKNDLWIATDGGVNVLSVRNDSFFLDKRITLADGISSKQIRQLVMLDGMAYLGMERGLGKVDLSRLDQFRTKEIPLYFTNIRINDKDTTVLEKYRLSHLQRAIRIDFEAIDFKQSGDILYKYRMKGISNQWDSTTNRNVLYSSLSPGPYVFEVAAQFANGDWTRPIQIEFFISKPFWVTWWFRIGAAFFLFGAAYLLYASSSAARKKREQLTKELNTSRQMALGSQINPHFIFNSLNAIYNFLLKNKDEIAQSYLVRFSRLIRNVFENSMERYIPLNQELETLKLYLELEQLRFSNKFSYHIHIAEDIRQDSTYIPPMLLQPLVENAIWHGLLNKEDHEPPLLQIRVEKEGDKLQFAISDNGVGLSQSREKQKNQILRKGKSTGLTITKKRVSLVNEYYNKEFYFSVEENKLDPLIKGTTVAFSLPHISSKPE